MRLQTLCWFGLALCATTPSVDATRAGKLRHNAVEEGEMKSNIPGLNSISQYAFQFKSAFQQYTQRPVSGEHSAGKLSEEEYVTEYSPLSAGFGEASEAYFAAQNEREMSAENTINPTYVYDCSIQFKSEKHPDKHRVEFRAMDMLGAGSYGQVWTTRAVGSGHVFAVKLQKFGVGRHEQRLLSKAQAVPGVVRLHDYGVCDVSDCRNPNAPLPDDVHCMFIDIHLDEKKLPRKNLEDEELALWREDKEMPIKNALRIMRDLTKTVHAMHILPTGGVVHMDLKEANVIQWLQHHYTWYGVWSHDQQKITLIDFGVSQDAPIRIPGHLFTARLPDFTPAGGKKLQGTQGYRAPETYGYFYNGEGGVVCDPKMSAYGVESDVYSLGIMLYRMIGGYKAEQTLEEVCVSEAFEALGYINEEYGAACFSPAEKYPEYSGRLNPGGGLDDIRELVIAMTQVNPSERPSTDEVIAKLESLYKKYKARNN